ncbi:MAG: hypothetical protein NT151_05455 [Acidobacteria bacterium]|jgi:hypothetical protein|nr:hypothetical protein [Acidobacteriota bacterium]
MKLVRVSALAIACSFAVTALAAAQTSTKPTQNPPPAAKVAPIAKAFPAAKAEDPAAKLPKLILDAFKKAYPKAVIKNVAEEKENGKTTWEVESTDSGLARDLIYNPDGTVVEFEEVVAATSLPPAVTAALKAKYPKATITKAEKLFKGKATTFEMAIAGAGTVKSIEITPEGKVVPPAKKAGEKDEKEDVVKKDVKKQ